MTPQQWQRVKVLFGVALEQPEAERAAFLDQVCGPEDLEVRREVEALLAAHEESDSFLETPAGGLVPGASAEPSTLAQGQTIGRYRLLGLLGSGGMGQVYLAEDPRLRRMIALKLLPRSLSRDPDRLRRFAQEARAASALSHPNVCVIYEVGESGEGDEERHFIAMEYVLGESLRQRLERHRAAGTRMPLEEVLDIAQQAAAGLTAAHAARVVHRDVKPENLMIRPDGLVKVLDFGLAKLADPDARASAAGMHSGAQTEPGMVMGTVQYMSPEQARGLPVDHRTDIWSLGATLYEMLACQPAFEGPTTTDIMVAVLEREPAPLAGLCQGVPPGVQEVIVRALRKEREARHPSMREMAAELKGVQREVEQEAERVSREASSARTELPPAAPFKNPTAGRGSRATDRLSRRSMAVLGTVVLAGLLVPAVLYLDPLGIGENRQSSRSASEEGIAAAVQAQDSLPQTEIGQTEERSRTKGRENDPNAPNGRRASVPTPATPGAPGSSTPMPTLPVTSEVESAAVDPSATLLQDSILLERQFDRLDTGLPRVRLEAIRDTTHLVWDRWSSGGIPARHRGRAAYVLGTVWNALDSPSQCATWMERAVDLQPARANYRRMLDVCRSLLQ